MQLTATAAPGHTLAELERSIVEEIARLAADGPTDEEIDRGRVQAEAQFMFRLQTVGGFGGKSDQLNAYNMFLRRSRRTSTRDLARYQVVTTESLQEVAGRYLDPARRVTLSIVPQRARRAGRARFRAGGRVVSARPLTGPAKVDRSRLPEPEPTRTFPFPAIEKSTLPNGLRVWTRASHAGAGGRVHAARAARRGRPIRRARTAWPR